MPIVEYTIIAPEASELIGLVLEAIRSRKPVQLVAEIAGVARPWARRRQIDFCVCEIVHSKRWLIVGGEPPPGERPDWLTLALRVWNGPGAPERWRSWEVEVTGMPENGGSAEDVHPATLSLVCR